MVPSIHSNSLYHASHSREVDWNHCCAKVMGFDDWALVDLVDGDHQTAAADNSSSAAPNVQVTNLLPSDLFGDDNDQENNANNTPKLDPWTENALNIQADLERMSSWILSKRWAFISFDMDDSEASLIQSTVTSFAATTANEIESLRKMAVSSSTSSSTNSNEVQHRTGIVQILFARLKEDIVEPFGVLQKHRSRQAVHLWQTPLQCKLLVKHKKKRNTTKHKAKRDEIDQALGMLDDDEDNTEQEEIEKSRREQRFLPRREAHQLRDKFMETYSRDEDLTTAAARQLMKRPKSLVKEPLSVLSSETETRFQSNNPNQPQQPQFPERPATSTSIIPGVPDYSYEEMTEAAQEQMQQEALMLQSMVHSDLDSVQKMEQQMVSITTLLTQFSELVSEQSEEVWHIHETAEETKSNVSKGQNALMDAAEKTHQSQHYMAKGIFAMGCLLLLLHWLRP